jgi:DNA polymerase-3 subunit alpha (Gram-positive type)
MSAAVLRVASAAAAAAAADVAVRTSAIARPTPYRVVFYDLETTGLNPYHDHVIEMAVCDTTGRAFTSLIACPVPLSPRITEITGLRTVDLAGAPEPLSVAEKLFEFIYGEPTAAASSTTTTILVGHNAYGFDRPFLTSWLERIGVEQSRVDRLMKSASGDGSLHRILHADTMRLCQYYYPGRYSYSLQALCKYAGIETPNAHRAAGDVAATAQLFAHVVGHIRRLKGGHLTELDICQPTMQPSSWW